MDEEGPLDMRMDRSEDSPLRTASQLLLDTPQDRLAHLLVILGQVAPLVALLVLFVCVGLLFVCVVLLTLHLRECVWIGGRGDRQCDRLRYPRLPGGAWRYCECSLE